MISNLINNYRPVELTQEREPKGLRPLTYVRGLSERIEHLNIRYKGKYKIAHKTYNTLKLIFSNTKDKIPTMEKHNFVYEIPCSGNKTDNCQQVYVGTTKSKIKVRIKNHKSDFKLKRLPL